MKTKYELNVNEIAEMIEKEFGSKEVTIEKIEAIKSGYKKGFKIGVGVGGVLNIFFEGEKE